MERNEDRIREQLVKRLDIFSQGITYIDQEHFLPNEEGTRGFVDILASDDEGRYILIELKRSKAASREAIHEVLKYIEGIKENKSLKNDEIKALIVSTDWDELLVPFSSFVSQVEYEVIGFELTVDENFIPTEANIVTPISINNERIINDYHEVFLYSCEENMLRGIDSISSCFRQKNIHDYILLTLTAHPDFHEYSLRATAQGFLDIATQFGIEPSKKYEDLQNEMLEFTHMIYSATQVISEQQCLNIIREDTELAFEIQEFVDDLEECELVDNLNRHAISDAKPRPYKEHYEIGYPAKL